MVMRAKISALWAGLVLLALLTLLWTVLLSRDDGMDWDWGISILVAWWMTLVVAGAGTVFAAGRLRILMGIAMLCGVGLIALLFSGFDGDLPILWGLWLGGVSLVQCGLLALLDLRTSPIGRGLRRVTYGLAVVLAAGFFVATSELFDLPSPYEEWHHKSMIFVCMINAAGTIAVYLLAGMDRLRRPPPESIPSGVTLSAACPRCNTVCTFGQGKSSCPSCGLRVTLEIEEPRCECGYLLYKLDSDQCPECGRPIRRRGVADRAATPV
jgi:hypothetical protein